MALSPDETEGLIYVRNTCGRCGGSGQLWAWNSVTQTQEPVWCPICKGTGEAQYFASEGAPHTNLPTNRRYADGNRRR